MATPASKPKRPSATAEQILDLAEMLIQTRSYGAFSYQDISDARGVGPRSIDQGASRLAGQNPRAREGAQ
jgi:AcrR family transcriptional regulator